MIYLARTLMAKTCLPGVDLGHMSLSLDMQSKLP